ncbi:MAG: hypothetical protein GY851_28885 [bacterium]|nr:hypothetical protein [bacterium]
MRQYEADCTALIVRLLTRNGCAIHPDEVELTNDGASWVWMRNHTTEFVHEDEFEALFEVNTFGHEDYEAEGITWIDFATDQDDLRELLGLFDDETN